MKTPVLSILDLLHFDCPTQEQKAALLAMANFVKEESTDDFFILCGAAGTGKSSIMSALVGYLNQMDVAYQIAAPTGRAARVIGRKTNTLTSTVHSLIYIPKPNSETGIVHFTPRPTDDDTRTIFVIDEASMMSAQKQAEDGAMFVAPSSLLQDFATHIKACNPKNKVIFLGDRYQLPPVGEQESRALQATYLETNFSWKGSAHLLTEVKRQADGSQILKNATRLRKAVDEGGSLLVEAPRVGHNVWATAAHFVAQRKSYDMDTMVAIGRSHRQNRVFNEAVREKMFGNKPVAIKAGDLMLVTQNWTRNGQTLYNGDHVAVEHVNLDSRDSAGGLWFCTAKLRYKRLDGSEGEIEDYILLDCMVPDDGKLTSVQEKALRGERHAKNLQYRESGNAEDDRYVGAIRLMYGYAITCNKAQGGEWEKVYLNVFKAEDARWLYTAVTRAKEELVKF